MTITVGEQLPQINFTTMTDEGPKPVTPSELFTGKKVAFRKFNYRSNGGFWC